jgi:hypothetical protein
MWKVRRQAAALQDMGAGEIKQNRARQDALKQKTKAGPALRECGKQTLQSILRCWSYASGYLEGVETV